WREPARACATPSGSRQTSTGPVRPERRCGLVKSGSAVVRSSRRSPRETRGTEWSATTQYRDRGVRACQGGGFEGQTRRSRRGRTATVHAYYHGAMFVGHLGAGLAAKRLAPALSLGVLFLAAMLLDAFLWIFVLLGVEAVHVPANFGEVHYL